MTEELDWVLEQFASVVDAVANEYTLKSDDPVTLRRVNRDDSEILEQDLTDIHGELQQAAYVGATHVDTVHDPIGTEYDASREAVIGVRVAGLTHEKFGHVDPSGTEGVPFTGDGGLVPRLKGALWGERTWPDAGPQDVYYTHLELQNEANTSHQWTDAFRADWDVVFDGYREL